MQISRIRLSDKTSRLRPRHVVPKPAQAYEPEVPVEVREWIAPASSPPDFVLEAQPPAQPHRRVADTGLAGPRRKHSPERVSQEVELSFRHFADACLLLVHCQLQLAHDLAQSLQSRFSLAPSAQDHEVVRVGYEASAEGSLKPEHLPSQHEPAHVNIG